jgi:hypothetical protein
VLWLDAAHGLTLSSSAANTQISHWNDQSGHGHDAINEDLIHQPIWRSGAGPNGLPAVMFSRSNTWLAVADAPELNTGTDDFTLELVTEWTNPTFQTLESYGNAALFMKQEPDVLFGGLTVWANTPYQSGDTTVIDAHLGLLLGQTGWYMSASAGLNDGRFRLYSISRMDGTALGVRIDGNVDPNAIYGISADVNGDAIGSPIILGANPGDPGQALNGAISEVIFVHGHLDQAQIERLEAYLLQKYGF